MPEDRNEKFVYKMIDPYKIDICLGQKIDRNIAVLDVNYQLVGIFMPFESREKRRVSSLTRPRVGLAVIL